VLDTVVWEEYTSDSNYRSNYDTNSIAHLLRFMRNAHQHNRAGSAANKAFVADGGIEFYFLSRFPLLLLVVRDAILNASRSTRPEFREYLPATHSGRQKPAVKPAYSAPAHAPTPDLPAAHVVQQPSAPTPTTVDVSTAGAIANDTVQVRQQQQQQQQQQRVEDASSSVQQWLLGLDIGEADASAYAAGLKGIGADSVRDLGDLEQADLADIGVKRLHARKIMRAISNM
jgi:hypothetical protein